jgi:hypothetical protein
MWQTWLIQILYFAVLAGAVIVGWAVASKWFIR